MGVMRTVSYTRDARRTLLKLPRPTAERIVSKIDQLAADPASLANNVKALKGGDGFRLRVGDYRVIYTDTLTVLTIVKIGHRGGVYD